MNTQKVRLNDGAIVLHKRGHIYHMQIKIGTKYIRETCGTNDLETAKSVAYSRYDDLRLIVKQGGTIEKSPKVGLLYNDYEQWLKDEYKDAKYRQYKGQFEKYFLFRFGNHQIKEITEEQLQEWLVWRQTILTPKKKPPTSSTVHNDLVVLKDFYNWCVSKGYIKKREIPEFPKFKVESQRRPAFINGLDKKLIVLARNSFERESHPTTRSKREDLYTYIRMMLACGSRSGELASIGLKHLSKIKVKQKGKLRETFAVQLLEKTKTISGKRSHKRTAVFMPDCFDVIQKHIKKYAKKNIDLTDRFWPQHKSFENGFDNLLTRNNLKIEPITGLSYSIYSLRHTYITNRLLAGVTSDLIASQCGTSVKMIEEHYSNVVPLLAKNKVVALDEESVEYNILDTQYSELFEEK